MTGPADILEFENVTLAGVARGYIEMRGLTFKLAPGRLMLIKVEAGNEYLPIADAAEGLIAMKSGHIRWQSNPWKSISPKAEMNARAQIGRVFEKNSWISNLNVNENVTLSQRHHTTRPEADISAEADQLARYFGLTEVPRQRPAFAAKRELRVAEWVRALIGKPLLLLLERPEEGVPDNNLPKLIEAVRDTLRRGAAAIWQTDREMTLNASICSNQIRYRMRGADMLLMEDKQP